MKFNLEHKNNLLFSDTSIPDIFISDYLPNASGDAIKVYIYCLLLSKLNHDITISDLSKKLEMSVDTLKGVLFYWEEKEILIKTPSGYILNNIKELELNKIYQPKLSQSIEVAIKNNEANKMNTKAVQAINSCCFQGVMSTSWYSDIDFWFEKFKFDPDVMVALFKYCFDRKKLNKNYIFAVAETWSKHEIHNFMELENYLHEVDSVNEIKNFIIKKLKFNRNLTDYEDEFVRKWFFEFKYDKKVIELAMKKTINKSNPNLNYINTIITNWYNKGLLTIEDIQKEDIQNKISGGKQLTISNIVPQYQNYEQRQYDNLDSLYSNM